jgi:hypothetical protein
MNSAVCTLFEGNYHYGVGALTNSLYAHGFRGTIYCGYRGALPPWIAGAKTTGGFTEFSPVEGIVLRFIALATKFHLTNFKPDFMLELWRTHCPDAQSLFYFDPDITILCRWSFYEEWAKAGVMMCADINPDMPVNHPLRHAWKKFYEPHGTVFRRETDIYFNGGFVGLKREDMEFLHCWQKLQEQMAPEIGGLQNVNVKDRTYLFHKTDQDAMNVAAMASEAPISPMAQDGMDFQHGGGGYVMSHALGGQKPWKKKFLRSAILEGIPPSRGDRTYFRQVETPIRLYSPAALKFKNFCLLTASLIGRFMRRG